MRSSNIDQAMAGRGTRHPWGTPHAMAAVLGMASSILLLSCWNSESCSSFGPACRVDEAWPETNGQPILEVCSSLTGTDYTWTRRYCLTTADGGGPENCLGVADSFDVVCRRGFCFCR